MLTTNPQIKGLLLTAIGAITSLALSANPYFLEHNINSLTIAIFIGILISNLGFNLKRFDRGVDYSKSELLKMGIILYGLRVSLNEIQHIGITGFLIDITVVITTLTLAYLIGKKWLKEDLQTVILIGAGSSICGAAAILATEPIIKAPSNKVTIAVSTVVIFGTLSMFIEPLFYKWTGVNSINFGLYLGSTIHEVAQVVVAGRSINETISHVAVTEKMLRVMLLPFFLIGLSFLIRKNDKGGNLKKRITLPWFAILFIVLILIHNVLNLPHSIVKWGINLDNFLLTMAMFALGLRTHKSAFFNAGFKPFILASWLFVFLMVGGFFINLFLSNIIN